MGTLKFKTCFGSSSLLVSKVMNSAKRFEPETLLSWSSFKNALMWHGPSATNKWSWMKNDIQSGDNLREHHLNVHFWVSLFHILYQRNAVPRGWTQILNLLTWIMPGKLCCINTTLISPTPRTNWEQRDWDWVPDLCTEGHLQLQHKWVWREWGWTRWEKY